METESIVKLSETLLSEMKHESNNAANLRNEKWKQTWKQASPKGIPLR